MSKPVLENVLNKQRAIRVYLLAAQEDQHQCETILKYLSPIIRNSKRKIEIDGDFEIQAGEDRTKYKEKLLQADIVLAFISADFINDDDTYFRTQKVIERYNKNETIMLPILVRNCMWKSTPFVKLTLLPKNLQPLNNKQFWNSEDDAIMSVVMDINEAIQAFTYTPLSEDKAVISEVKEILSDDIITEFPIHEEPVEPDLSPNEDTATVPKEEDVASPEKAPDASPPVDEKEILPADDASNFELQDLLEPEPLAVTTEEAIKESITEIPETSAKEVIEENITADPPIAKEQTETDPVEPTKIAGKKANIPLEVNWRGRYYTKTYWKRGLAFLIDNIITVIPSGIISLLLSFLILDNFDGFMQDNSFEELMLAFIGFNVIFYCVLCAIFESSKFRGTWGKLILRLQITDRNGDRISFFKALWRNLLRMVTGWSYLLTFGLIGFFETGDPLLLLLPIPLIVQIFTFIKYKKLFHDQISYTVVGEKLRRKSNTKKEKA